MFKLKEDSLIKMSVLMAKLLLRLERLEKKVSDLQERVEHT